VLLPFADVPQTAHVSGDGVSTTIEFGGVVDTVTPTSWVRRTAGQVAAAASWDGGTAHVDIGA
jgi:hypothetical protein